VAQALVLNGVAGLGSGALGLWGEAGARDRAAQCRSGSPLGAPLQSRRPTPGTAGRLGIGWSRPGDRSVGGKPLRAQPETAPGAWVGSRCAQVLTCRASGGFSTYAVTLGLATEAAVDRGKEVVVLDRVNAITGRYEEGPLLGAASTFVGFHDLPLRHGLTVGELARLYPMGEGLPYARRSWAVKTGSAGSGFLRPDYPGRICCPTGGAGRRPCCNPGLGLMEQAASVGQGRDRPVECVDALRRRCAVGGGLERRRAGRDLVGSRSFCRHSQCSCPPAWSGSFLVWSVRRWNRWPWACPSRIAVALGREGVSLDEARVTSLAPAYVGGFAAGTFQAGNALTLATGS